MRKTRAFVELEVLAEQLQESNPKLSRERAITMAAKTHPDLARACREQEIRGEFIVEREEPKQASEPPETREMVETITKRAKELRETKGFDHQSSLATAFSEWKESDAGRATILAQQYHHAIEQGTSREDALHDILSRAFSE
jgi:hypothetical protein